MTVPPTAAPATEPLLSPDRHDAVLAALLGALAHTQRLEQRLQAVSSAGTPLADDDPVVLASLGALALGRRLRQWLHAAASPAPPPANPSVDEQRRPRGLLR